MSPQIPKKIDEDADKLNLISCAEVDYTEVDTGIHRLPINFNSTASNYNKLLITNGRSKQAELKVKANAL